MSNSDDRAVELLASALGDAQRGDGVPLERAVASLALTEPARKIWTRIVESAQFAVGAAPDPGTRPEELVSIDVRDPLARWGVRELCARGVRLALLDLDRARLLLWVELQTRDRDVDELARARLLCSLGWLAVLDGRELPALASGSEAIAAVGRRMQVPSLPIEAAVLSALEAERRGDLPEALGHARRASRMARTEALPQEEYLANWALARMRRLSGHPHLAVRIVVALLRVVTDSWRPLLAWELLASRGSSDASVQSRDAPVCGALERLDGLFDAARRGDRAGFDECTEALRALRSWSALHHGDAWVASLLLDPEAPFSGDEHVAWRWKRGEIDAAPLGLHGLGETRSAAEATAYVVCRPGLPPQRVLSYGVMLAPGAFRFTAGSTAQVRTDTTIAALALSGAMGIDQDALFERVYGFPYGGERHRGVRDVLFHRVRARLEGIASVTRSGSRLALAHDRAFALPDPRCSPPPEQSLLHELAKVGHLTASDAARRLDVNLRTVQRALKRLADDGVCEAVKRGKNVEFYLDDTTFHEPTGIDAPRVET